MYVIDAKRRELLNIAVRLTLSSAVLVGGVASLSACGGGGGSNSAAPGAPSGTSQPPPPAQATPTIKSLSNSSPQPLTALILQTENLDTTKPFTATITPASLQGTQTLTPIRSAADGSVVVAVPLHIDSATGKTAPLDASLTVTQNGVVSAPISVAIADLPQLSDLGLTLGQASRAFYNHQQVSLGGSINTQQALAHWPGATAAPASLLNNLNASLQAMIMARNDIDRIVTGP